MALRKSYNNRPWYPNKAGTRYIRDPKPVYEEKPKEPECSALMEPWLKGEASGDTMLAVLLAVRNLLRVPEAWTNKARAQGISGFPVEPTSPSAVRWNIMGGIEHVTMPYYSREQRRDVLEAIKRLLPAENRVSLGIWETEKSRRHTQVVHLLNMAVANRKRELANATEKIDG